MRSMINIHIPRIGGEPGEKANLKLSIESYEDKRRVVLIGDMNTRVGHREEENVIGKFGVPVMNDKKKKRGNEEWGAKMDRILRRVKKGSVRV